MIEYWRLSRTTCFDAHEGVRLSYQKENHYDGANPIWVNDWTYVLRSIRAV